MNGRQSISIAVLTEDQDDVALINSTLRDGGQAAHCHWISHPHDLDETLARKNVELIVLNCDKYPDSIPAVIKQKDRFNPEIPIIALSAEADENAMQQAMKDGACDLVSIGHKSRLQSVVTRELRALRMERALYSTLQSATEYKRQLKEHMAASTSAIALVQEGIITDINDAWAQQFKVQSKDELLGLPLMDCFEPDSQSALKGALVATIAGKWKRDEQLIAKTKMDADQELHLEFTRVDLDDGPSVEIRIKPQLQLAEEPTKLVHDALKRDPTTLFFHRAQFLERVTKRLRRKPDSGTHALVYIRPDKFDELVQKVGLLNSEEVLAQFAEEIRKRLHPRDVAGRFEGTAIMALLERGSARDAQVWGKQLIEHISKFTFEVNEHSVNLNCSVGACGMSEVFSSLEDFVAATRAAWVDARSAGGSTSILSETADEDTKQREFDAIWVKHLKAALMDDRFRLAKLPIAGLRSDSFQMFDVLVRMIDEQGNSVLPSEFIPAAERNNMMKHVDRWMFKAAVEFCEKSDADRVFVRLSKQSILDKSTIPWMRNEFEKLKFEPSRIIIQIPEEDAAKHIKQTKSLVQKSRKLGVGFAIEHYGIDQERFQILDMLEPEYIKIDGELIHALMKDTSLQRSVEKIVAAAKERDIQTVAERVENANAMAVLFQLGLDFMQGHYVHEPEVVLEDTDSGVQRTLSELAAASGS